MELALVGKRFQVVIPKKVRTLLGLKEGQSLAVTVQGGRIALEPVDMNILKKIPRYSEKRDEKRAEKFAVRHAGR